ncbi:hypothetical protein [Hyphomicrobium sp. MC1]|uniref:hypothetical protein n=1 Tax=Hyphomicrobium sp. (strain MC1) TaxID=717785 RepID=UPI00059BF2A4|nr:hypothetical protein [Hyphomicrobium sp. MC1]
MSQDAPLRQGSAMQFRAPQASKDDAIFSSAEELSPVAAKYFLTVCSALCGACCFPCCFIVFLSGVMMSRKFPLMQSAGSQSREEPEL